METEIRKFAQAFRALPAVASTPFNGTIEPAMPEVVARWHDDRLAVIKRYEQRAKHNLHFAEALPFGQRLVDVVTRTRVDLGSQAERQNVTLTTEAYSLTTFLQETQSLPKDQDGDGDVDLETLLCSRCVSTPEPAAAVRGLSTRRLRPGR